MAIADTIATAGTTMVTIRAIAAITGTGAITGATGVMTAAITVGIAGITAATAIDRPGGGDGQSSSWKPTFSVT